MRNWTSSSLLSPSRGTPTLPDSQVQAAVYDTDVASRSFKGRLPAALAARLVGRQPLVTFVTVGELTQWTRLRRWGPRNRAMLEDWLADKPVIPGGKSIAAKWGHKAMWVIIRAGQRPFVQVPHGRADLYGSDGPADLARRRRAADDRKQALARTKYRTVMARGNRLAWPDRSMTSQRMPMAEKIAPSTKPLRTVLPTCHQGRLTDRFS
jgi:hypothetical protein